jgi:UTP--glucose-1-phosphate uridylyltransferase
LRAAIVSGRLTDPARLPIGREFLAKAGRQINGPQANPPGPATPSSPAGPRVHPDRHFVSLKSPEILPTKQRLPFATPALRNLSAMSPIRKAIFPVAGLGTRFLPATKAMPKEMLTVVDRPIIQHVVDEAREAGIEHFIFVTGRNKGVIEDHFDRQLELEFTLNERGKHAELELLNRELPGAGTTSFTRQQTPLGLGHAVWCARELVGREPFALLLPDVLVQAPHGCLKQMIDAYRDLGERANIIAVEEIPADRTHMYGVVGVGERRGNAFSITAMVEKPPRGSAPSNLIITGRYILQPEIFDILETQDRGAGGEIQITDAMIRLALKLPFYGLKFEGRTFDCGSKIGFLAANVAYALAREDMRAEFRAELEKLLGEK